MSFNQIIILSAVFEARNQRTYCAFVACEVSCHEQALSHALQEEYILIRPGHATPVCGVLSYRAFSAFSVLRRARKWHTYATVGLWTIPIGSSLSKTQKTHTCISIRPGYAKRLCGLLSYRFFSAFSKMATAPRRDACF